MPMTMTMTRRLTPLFAACVFAPAIAQAGPVSNPDMQIDVAAQAGLNPPELPLKHDARPAHLGDKVVFVNFDGADMNSGCGNNPANNCSTIFSGTVLPYFGDKAERAGVVQVMRAKLADFGISVTGARPASGDYDMEMVGPWEGGSPGGVGGIAPAGDCWDNAGGQVSFTMLTGGPEGVADVIMQEIAHTWGLSHVDDDSDLLYPTTSGGEQGMVDQCFQIVSDTSLTPSSSGCGHHQDACNSSSQQNSYAELLLIFGQGYADTTAPVSSIITPTEGEVLASGVTVDLRIALQDEQDPMVITTLITLDSPALPMPVETGADYAAPSEYNFPMNGLPDGSYTATLQATDESGNMAPDAVVNFVIGMPSETTGASDTTSDSETTSDSDTTGGSDSETTGGSDSGPGGTSGAGTASSGGSDTDGTASGGSAGSATTVATGDGTGDGSDDAGGCACSTAPSRDTAWMLLPLLFVFGGPGRRTANRR